jgi:putative transferase (TIGR04331 family)
LFVDLEDFLQTHSMLSGILGSTMLKHLESIQCFVEELLPEVRKLLFIRPQPTDRGWGSIERWKELDPNLYVYRGRETVYRQINRSRLLVVPYNSTTHLETLAVNFPTLFFWKPDQTELRPTAQKYHDLMHEVGVFHKSPESAAEKVNQIYQDPLGWWLSPEIQKARKIFCLQYAWAKKTWRADWKKELLNIAGE